jgi:hypothetical protein
MIRRGMKFRHHGSILVLTSMLALASNAGAQEAAYLDLTDTILRLELRHPPAPPAKCDHGCVGGGIGGGSVGDFGVGANEKHVLTATLTWMDRVEYQDGDEAIVEVRLQNTGELPVSIAWSPHLADMQPPNETDKFTVLSLGIAVELNWAGQSVYPVGHFELYGSPEQPHSMLDLAPGESARVRARMRIDLPHSDKIVLPGPDTEQYASASCWVHKNTYSPRPGGIYVSAEGIPPLGVVGGRIAVTVIPEARAKE